MSVKVFIAAIGWLGLGLINSPAGTNAQMPPDTGSGLRLLPAIQDISATPGETTPFQIRLENPFDAPAAVQVLVQPLVPRDELIDSSARERFDATAWIKTDTPQLLLDGKEIKNLEFALEPPADAAPGGHYALLSFRVLNTPPNTAASGSQIAPEVSSTLIITVPGDSREAAAVAFAPLGKYQLQAERNFSFSVANTGDVHILPSFDVLIRNSGGDVAGTIPISPRLILPNTRARFEFAWEAPGSGSYTAEVRVRYGTPTADASAVSNEFVVLPAVWVLLLWLSVISAFILLVLQLVSRRLKRSYRPRPPLPPAKPVRSIPVRDLDELASDRSVPDVSRKK